MLIAIEGPPCTGKTELARELCEQLPALGGQLLAPSTNDFTCLMQYEDEIAFYDPLGDGEESVVLDGSHLGELVWPEIFHRPTDMIDPAIRRHIEMFMCSRGCVTIYATRDYTDLHEALHLSSGAVRPASLALVLERYEQALAESHSRGFIFEHNADTHPLGAKDIAFIAGQADDDVRPLYGLTNRWIGNPHPRWIIATSGYSDQELPGRLGSGLNPTVGHLLRCLPESAWRGALLVDIEEMSDEGLYEFSLLAASAESWTLIGDHVRDRVQEVVHPVRSWSPGYAIAQSQALADTWSLWVRDEIASA